MHLFRIIGGLAALMPGLMAQSGPAHAGADGNWRIGVLGTIWAETNLPELPYNTVSGKLKFHETYFTAVELTRVLVRDFSIPTPFGNLPGNDIELSGQVVKHWGKQKHVELTAALGWRSGNWRFIDAMSVNFSYANGLSVALKRPAWEKGPEGVRGVNSRHVQFYIMTELEFTPTAAPDWHMVLRLHHRSGIYGLISPQRTGSNYLGFGLRKDF